MFLPQPRPPQCKAPPSSQPAWLSLAWLASRPADRLPAYQSPKCAGNHGRPRMRSTHKPEFRPRYGHGLFRDVSVRATSSVFRLCLKTSGRATTTISSGPPGRPTHTIGYVAWPAARLSFSDPEQSRWTNNSKKALASPLHQVKPDKPSSQTRERVFFYDDFEG